MRNFVEIDSEAHSFQSLERFYEETDLLDDSSLNLDPDDEEPDEGYENRIRKTWNRTVSVLADTKNRDD